MPRKSAAEKAAEAEATEADAGFIDTDGDGDNDAVNPANAELTEPVGDKVEDAADDGPGLDEGAPPNDADLDEAAEAPDDYAPGGGGTASFEDTAPPGDTPGNDAVETMDNATAFENALIERNQRRYELRSSGLSSAEVNEIEEDEREAARS